jgi:WD40 repeat protein
MSRLLFVIIFLPFISFSQTLETIIQKGHELAVVSIAVSTDSNYVATASRDKSAKLWEVSTGREVRSFLGHDLSVTSVEFSPDGKSLATGSNDKTVKIWNIETGKEQASIPVNYRVTSLAFEPSGKFLFVAGYQTEYTGRAYNWDDSVTVIDLRTKRSVKKIEANPDKGLGFGVDVATSPDGKWLAIGEDNRKAHIYSLPDFKNTFTLEFQNKESSCGGCNSRVVFSPDSKNVYMASHNGPVKKYNLQNGGLVKTYSDVVKDLTGFSISTDGEKIACATEKEIIVWNEESGSEVTRLIAKEEGDFNEVRFMATPHKLLISSNDNTAFIWNVVTQKKETTLTGFLNQRDRGGLNYDANFHWQAAIAKFVRFKNNLLIANDGKTLVKGKFGTKVKRWDVATGKSEMEFVGHKKAVLCYDLSKDGRKLITGGGDGTIILWDFDTGDSIKVITSYREPIFDIHFNSEETKVVTSSWDATMKIHNLETMALEHYVDFQTNAAYNVIFHPNDLYLFTSRLDNSLQMWEIDTKKEVRNFVGHTDIVSSINLSPDQKTLLSASWDGSIRLWNISSGLMDKKLKGHSGTVHIAIFSADGKNVYSAGSDRSIRLWDISTSKVVKTFEGHNAEITSLLLSPDNKMLISHSVDGVTKFWDLATGKEFFEHIHLGEKDWMAKNPEGYFSSTDNARKFIHFVNGTKTYSVDQFFNEFYRPELLPKIFENRRGGEEQKGIQGKLQSSPPPQVRVAIVPTTEPGKAELFVKITDNGAGAENLKVFHNGKSISIDRASLKLPSGKGESSTYRQILTLVGGTNTFSASAVNRDKLESDSHSAEIFSDHSSKNSVCYLLAVGINKYKNPRMSLNYAKPDAKSFTDVMSVRGTLFKNVELHTLYDQEASRTSILKKLDELSTKIQPEDVFIFYYAGHGSMVDNQFFFIPTESLRLYDLNSLKADAIDAATLQEKFKNIKALKQLIIMDACQSGGSVELLATRGASEEKAIAQLSRSAGIHVMASAGSDQFAAEFAQLGHGMFTYLLLKALEGDADGAPKDGKVTIYELKSYLDDQVPEMTRKLKGKPQYPYTFSRGQDFPVVIEN